MSRKLVALVSLAMILSLALGACAPAAAPAAAPTEPPKVVQQTVVVKETVPPPTAAPDRIQIRWYIGLGTGSEPEKIPLEKAFAEKFNKAQNEIQLIPEIVANNYARDNLKAQIAAGNAPDIVGPVGKRGRGYFIGAFLDLQPLIDAAKYNMGDVDQTFLDFYKDEGKLVGLPFAIFPSVIYYNKALFDEAKLPYPPHKYGDKYNGKEWNLETLQELAMKLTVDKNGNDATSAKFDPKNIVQYGYEEQMTDARGLGTLFGGGSLVDDKGNAQIPAQWVAAWKWAYDAQWKLHFMPNQAALASDLLAAPSPFGSGKIAMAHCHLWILPWGVPKDKVPNWDIAAVPAVNGKTTAKLHGDTFSILAGSKHPKEAFKVLTYMLGAGSQELFAMYGGMPLQKDAQTAFFADLSKQAAPNVVDWQVAIDSLKYFDVPNHEAGMPNFSKADDAVQAFGTDMRSTENLDLDARIAKFKSDLDAIFKEKVK